MRRVRGQRTTDSFKRLLLCIFSRTGTNFTRICEVLPNEYTPQWIAARIGPHGHGSLLGDDVWYAVYWDYSDLPSDTWKQTARSLSLAMLSERGVTPTTADQIKFDVFVTSLQDAPAWREQKKLEKAERASQKRRLPMRTLLVLAPAHWRGGSTHWPATSWVRMQWAGSQAQGHGAPPVVLHLSGAARHRVAHATRQCQRTAARECAHRTA